MPASFADCIEIHGHRLTDAKLYANVEGEVAFTKKDMAHPTRLRDAVLQGRQIQYALGGRAAQEPGGHIRYAFVLDTSSAGRRAGRALWRQKHDPAIALADVFGLGKVARVENETTTEVRSFFLEGLDNDHVMDRLVGVLWEWHAETYGDGPLSTAGKALRKAQNLEQRLGKKVQASVPTSTRRPRL